MRDVLPFLAVGFVAGVFSLTACVLLRYKLEDLRASKRRRKAGPKLNHVPDRDRQIGTVEAVEFDGKTAKARIRRHG